MELSINLNHSLATNLCILRYLNFKMGKFPRKRKAFKNGGISNNFDLFIVFNNFLLHPFLFQLPTCEIPRL